MLTQAHIRLGWAHISFIPWSRFLRLSSMEGRELVPKGRLKSWFCDFCLCLYLLARRPWEAGSTVPHPHPVHFSLALDKFPTESQRPCNLDLSLQLFSRTRTQVFQSHGHTRVSELLSQELCERCQFEHTGSPGGLWRSMLQMFGHIFLH